MCYWICLLLVVLPLLLESVRLRRWRVAVPIRIHVHGTRGKTGTTAALAGLLRRRGYSVLAKTTGDKPEYIMPDGSLRRVRRWGPARIQEHVDVLRIAARLRVDAVVVEGMALQPETVFQSEQILRATHAVVVNVRPDHQETMGVGRRGVVRTLELMLPTRGRLYTAMETGAAILCAHAEQAGIPSSIVPTPSTRHQSDALAVAVADEIGVRRCPDGSGRALVRGRDMASIGVDDTQAKTVVTAGVTVRFYDLYSANDVVSARLAWQSQADECGDGCLRVALLATRADRPLRTRAFMDWLCSEPRFDVIVPVGAHTCYALLHGALAGRRAHHRPEAVAGPWTTPQGVLKRLCGLARRRGCRELAVVGLANAHGFGMHWRALVSRLEAP